MGKDGDVERREDNEEDSHNGPEQECVAPEVANPGFEAARHVKERAAEVDELPGEEQEDPSHGSVAGRTGAEDLVACKRVAVVTLLAEVAIVEAKDDDGEGAKDATSHENAVDKHVEEELGCEDAVFELRQ